MTTTTQSVIAAAKAAIANARTNATISTGIVISNKFEGTFVPVESYEVTSPSTGNVSVRYDGILNCPKHRISNAVITAMLVGDVRDEELELEKEYAVVFSNDSKFGTALKFISEIE